MRAIHAIAGGLLLGGGVGWWVMGHPGYETAAQQQARIEAAQAQAAEEAEPKLYRWRDANGVLQLTGEPPKDRKYERVKMREDVNVIPMSPAQSSSTPAASGQ